MITFRIDLTPLSFDSFLLGLVDAMNLWPNFIARFWPRHGVEESPCRLSLVTEKDVLAHGSYQEPESDDEEPESYEEEPES